MHLRAAALRGVRDRGRRHRRLITRRAHRPRSRRRPPPQNQPSSNAAFGRSLRDTHDQIISRSELRTALLPVVPDRYRAVVGIAADTGLRWGEVIGLRDDVIDLDAARLRVIRTVVEVSGHSSIKPYPKSSAGRRSIPLPPWLWRWCALIWTPTRPEVTGRDSRNRPAEHCSEDCSARACGGRR